VSHLVIAGGSGSIGKGSDTGILKLKDYPSCGRQASVGEGVIHVAKWKLRSCPRCDGDMFTDTDLYGQFVQCLQCGYVCYSRYTVKSDKSAYDEKEEEKVVATLGKG